MAVCEGTALRLQLIKPAKGGGKWGQKHLWASSLEQTSGIRLKLAEKKQAGAENWTTTQTILLHIF